MPHASQEAMPPHGVGPQAQQESLARIGFHALYNGPTRTGKYARCIRWAHAKAVHLTSVPMCVCKLCQGVMLLCADMSATCEKDDCEQL